MSLIEIIADADGTEAQYPAEVVPLEEETDHVCAVLRRMASRGNNAAAHFAYQYLEEDDYISEQALHRVVEDFSLAAACDCRRRF